MIRLSDPEDESLSPTYEDQEFFVSEHDRLVRRTLRVPVYPLMLRLGDEYSAARRQFDRLYGPQTLRTAILSPGEWRRCAACGGTGMFEEQRDLHRSGGLVPCSCDDGTVKSITLHVRRRVRVAAGSRRV